MRIAFLPLVILPLSALAQSERLRVGATAGMEAGFTADRPGATTGVDVLPKGVELGAAYMLTPRLQLDLATDIYLNYPKRYFNLMVGIAWQITKK